MPDEFDQLLEDLEQRPGVEDPQALARWIWERSGRGDPLQDWLDIGGGRHIRKMGRTTFELTPGPPRDDIDVEPGWKCWTLRNDGDAVAMWQLPVDDDKMARALAEDYIQVWDSL